MWDRIVKFCRGDHYEQVRGRDVPDKEADVARLKPGVNNIDLTVIICSNLNEFIKNRPESIRSDAMSILFADVLLLPLLYWALVES